VLRRRTQVPVALLLLACGVLLTATIDHGTVEQQPSSVWLAPLHPPTFSVTSGRGRLLLDGTTASADHEAVLLQIAADRFIDYEVRSDFRPGAILADNWESNTGRLLYAVAATESSHAVMQHQSVAIRGVTSDPETFAARLEFLRENLPSDTRLSSDVVVVQATASIGELCGEAFSELVFDTVSFKESSAEIRSASFAAIDRITDFAHDCQQAVIVITGHTDASGDESWNRQLSLARAQAVADHIARNGIAPERLLVRGLGSSLPIADNATAQGRELNRRIEFEIR
jgi:OOP family OmpA-OmpF porin